MASSLEEARGRILNQLSGPSYTGKIPEWATLLVAEFEAAAKAAAVEPIAQALLEPTAITCDTDGVVLSDQLVRAIEGVAEAHTTTEEG